MFSREHLVFILLASGVEILLASGASSDGKDRDDPWELPPPQGLNCNGSSVFSVVEPGVTDAVSFMVAFADDPERWPFLQYSVPVPSDGDGKIQAVLPGLAPDTRYIIMARAHKRGEMTGWYKKWSKVSHVEGVCVIPSSMPADDFSSAGEEPRAPVTKPRTRWIEMFRVNGPSSFSPVAPDAMNNYTLPDYLENHNAFPYPPSDASILAYWSAKNSSVARYCVELEDVTFDNVTTPGYQYGGAGRDVHTVTSNYADYLSCNAGRCQCMVCGDQVVYLSHNAMKQACPMTPEEEKWVDAHYNPNETTIREKQQLECHYTIPSLPFRQCTCPNLAQSLKYVGMATGMFSFPLGGQCAFGAHVGDRGCTWRLDPLSFSVSMGGLAERGGLDPKKTPEENIAAALAAYKQLGASPCGSDPMSPKLSMLPALVV